ncbi:unnamed protein product, partial [Rotaria sp. Silwood2]
MKFNIIRSVVTSNGKGSGTTDFEEYCF